MSSGCPALCLFVKFKSLKSKTWRHFSFLPAQQSFEQLTAEYRYNIVKRAEYKWTINLLVVSHYHIFHPRYFIYNNNLAELSVGQENNLDSLPVQRVNLQTSDLLVMRCHTNILSVSTAIVCCQWHYQQEVILMIVILTQIFKSANLAIVLANWAHLFIFNQKDNIDRDVTKSPLPQLASLA